MKLPRGFVVTGAAVAAVSAASRMIGYRERIALHIGRVTISLTVLLFFSNIQFQDLANQPMDSQQPSFVNIDMMCQTGLEAQRTVQNSASGQLSKQENRRTIPLAGQTVNTQTFAFSSSAGFSLVHFFFSVSLCFGFFLSFLFSLMRRSHPFSRSPGRSFPPSEMITRSLSPLPALSSLPLVPITTLATASSFRRLRL